MSARIIAQLAVIAGTTLLISSPAQSAVVMNATFDTTSMTPAGPFNHNASVNPIGTVDDSADSGGIWSANQIDVLTSETYGKNYVVGPPATLDGGLRIRSRTVSGTPVGGVASGDIGSSISSGTVTVTMDLNRATRGGIIGGMATQRLTNAAGIATDMLFGVIWEHNFVYNIDPTGYYGSQFAAVANSNAVWDTITFTLDFSTDTYDVSIGETGTVWTNLPMNTSVGNDSLRYIQIEAIPVQGSNVFYDNIVVDHVPVPEPAATGVLVVLGAAALGRRFRSGR